MEMTGHRSLEGVRSYKRISDEQREVLSDILSNKVPRIGENSQAVMPYQEQRIPATQQQTNIHTNNTKNSLPGTFNFNSCDTINFHVHY